MSNEGSMNRTRGQLQEQAIEMRRIMDSNNDYGDRERRKIIGRFRVIDRVVRS